MIQGWSDGPVVKRAYRFFRGPGQFPASMSVTLTPSGLHGQTHALGAYKLAKTHSYT